MGAISSIYNLRQDRVRMNDIADAIDAMNPDSWTNWTPVPTGAGGMTVTLATNRKCRYRRLLAKDFCFIEIDLLLNLSGTPSGWVGIDGFPLNFGGESIPMYGFHSTADGSLTFETNVVHASGTVIYFRKWNSGSYSLGQVRVRGSGLVVAS